VSADGLSITNASSGGVLADFLIAPANDPGGDARMAAGETPALNESNIQARECAASLFLIVMVLAACGKQTSTARTPLKRGDVHPTSLESAAVNGAPATCNGRAFYRPGGSIKPAVPVTRVNPVYDKVSAAPWRASVILAEAFVDSQGNVCGAGIIWHATPALDEETLRAFRQWKFHPATLDGVPINSVFSATFQVDRTR
jgi:hypothetical protein